MNLPGVLQRIDPPGTPSPLVFDFPHSGRDYPEDFGSALPQAILRRAEDAYVGELLAGVAQRGVTTLRALFREPTSTQIATKPTSTRRCLASNGHMIYALVRRLNSVSA
jgi:hypothetical protein